MQVLRIQHAVPNFEVWKRAFDSDPMGRKVSETFLDAQGVRYSCLRGSGTNCARNMVRRTDR